jgi:FixJ family two-component response regulator
MNETQLLPYLELMKRFAAHENAAARRSWGLIASPERHAQSVENSRLGGRSELIADDVELSPIAKKVLDYLEKDLTHKEIALLMGISRQAVGDTMRRHGITRKQLSKFRAKNDHQFKK